jgi:hypothetical protein
MSVLRVPAGTLYCLLALALPMWVFAGDASALADARAKWEAQAIASYSYVLQFTAPSRSAEAAEPVRVIVRKGKIVTVQFVQAKEGRPKNARVIDKDLRLTIADLFDMAARALDRTAAVSDLAFDPDYGFPTRISSVSTEVVDDAFVYSASDFKVLK